MGCFDFYFYCVGPLLFLVYINDLDYHVSASSLSLFADNSMSLHYPSLTVIICQVIWTLWLIGLLHGICVLMRVCM